MSPLHAERRLRLLDIAAPRRQLLAELLRHWEYLPETAAGAALVLRETRLPRGPGLELTCGDWHAALTFPFTLDELWILLQQPFSEPPRDHLRLGLTLPGTLRHASFEEPFFTVSLSDAGLRLRCGRELARGENVTLLLQLPTETLTLPAEVIYSFPSRSGYSLTSGLVFAPAAGAGRTRIREFLHATTLRQARSAFTDDEQFRAALACLALPPGVQALLATPL